MTITFLGAIAVALLMLVLIYGIYLVASAKSEVDEMPRTNMFVCDRHGPLQERWVMKLDVMGEKPIDYCSICFSEKMQWAKKKQ